MAHFIFKAKNAAGEIYSGQKDAADRYELYKLLREGGDEVVSFKEKTISKSLSFNLSFGGFGGHVKMIEKINFARNLSAMLEAGLALSRALGVLEKQSHNKAMKKIISELIEDVDRGLTFADAIAKHPKAFSELFASMVHAGEQSGTLSESLKAVASQMDSAYALEKRVRGAMTYPAVIVSAMAIIGVLMFIFVVPTLMKTFLDLKVALPLSTRIVFGIATTLQSYGILVLLLLIILAFLFLWWKKTPQGKQLIDKAVLKIPVIGGLIQEVNSARTARTLSSLLESGVDVVEALTITAAVVQNVHFRKILISASESIKKGDLMSKIFAEDEKFYPVFFSEMMSVGEETGKTGEMLLGVAKYYESDVEQRTKDMSTIIEPFLILFIGAVVGVFAVSMIQPIYSLMGSI